MRYELLFRTSQKIAPQQILDWFGNREGYSVDSTRALFKSEATGFTFSFNTEVDPDLNSSAIMYIEAPAPEIIVEEAEREVAAFANQFGFNIWDRQIHDGAFGTHSRERMLRDFSFYNKFTYKTKFVYLGGKPEAMVSREVWSRFWSWNSQVEKMQNSLGDSIFVPKILLVSLDNQIFTTVTMPAPIDVCLPEVDVIITAKSGPIAFDSLKPSLEKINAESTPVKYWKLSPVPQQFAQAFDSAKTKKGKLSMPPAQSILTEELLTEVLTEQKREKEEENEMRQAANAYNQARYQQAVDHCKNIQGQYAKMALMLSAVALGELARYDESFQKFESFFQREDKDPMVWNSYGYFLSSQGKKAEGEKAYKKALDLLEENLKKDPNAAELWSRKAYACLGLGQIEDALATAQKGAELESNNSLLAQHIGHAYMLLDKWNEAKEWMEKAVTLDDFNPYSKYYLAKVYIKLGDEPGAEKNIQYVKKVSPHLTLLL